MNRIEKVREYIDKLIINIPDAEMRRRAYVHLYGVSQASAMIALKRDEDAELSTIAGMLHDIYAYSNMERKEHAHKGAVMAKDILAAMELFDESEISLICGAIYNHSDKHIIHTAFDEVLKDADVMQHCLYDPLLSAERHEIKRFEKLKEEFGM